MENNGKIGYLLLGLVVVIAAGILFMRGNSSSDSKTALLSDVGQSLSNGSVVFRDLTVGNGIEAKNGHLLTVHYVGTLANGQKFDSSRDRGTPFQFTLGAGNVIRCWEEGMVGMKIGGLRELTCSPDAAYGDRGAGSIPPGATLKFEVELLNIGA